MISREVDLLLTCAHDYCLVRFFFGAILGPFHIMPLTKPCGIEESLLDGNLARWRRLETFFAWPLNFLVEYLTTLSYALIARDQSPPRAAFECVFGILACSLRNRERSGWYTLCAVFAPYEVEIALEVLFRARARHGFRHRIHELFFNKAVSIGLPSPVE